MINRINLAVLLMAIVITSCSTKFSLTKRRYNKGYHVEIAGNKPKQQGPVAVKESKTKQAAQMPQKAEVAATEKHESASTVNPATENRTMPALVSMNPQKPTKAFAPNTNKAGQNFIAAKSKPDEKPLVNPGLKNRKNTGAAPGGTMMGSDLMYGLFYGVGSVFVLFVFYMLFWVLLVGAFTNPEIFLAILAVVVIAALVIGILFIINAD